MKPINRKQTKVEDLKSKRRKEGNRKSGDGKKVRMEENKKKNNMKKQKNKRNPAPLTARLSPQKRLVTFQNDLPFNVFRFDANKIIIYTLSERYY